jgi:hypothetical protein
MGLSGIVWFDQGTKSIIEKIRGAIDGHTKRFGRMPQICLISKTQFTELKTNEVEGVPIHVWSRCLENHFIVGRDNYEQARQ